MRFRKQILLFREFFMISLLVVGGGYAIAAVANERFGKKLKWLKEGEILDNLPLISSVPGLIAGNTAIFTGLKTAGRSGAVAALLGVALPSLAVFTAVTLGFGYVPADNAPINAAFLALRSSLTAVVAATMYSTLMRRAPDFTKGVGVELEPLGARQRILLVAVALALLLVMTAVGGKILAVFLAFGTICIGGGFPLVPFYSRVFVGPDAPLIGMSAENFSNLMALTQMTPGPVSVNAATFFGISMGGIAGGVIATAALLAPSYFMMSAALLALSGLKGSRAAKTAFALMKPVALVLMCCALWKFASMSLFCIPLDGPWRLNPEGIVVFALSLTALLRFRLPVMAVVSLSAVAGLVLGLFA